MKRLKTVTINANFQTNEDLREVFRSIYRDVTKGKKQSKNNIIEFGVVDIEKNYKPSRIEDFGNGLSEVFQSKINEI